MMKFIKLKSILNPCINVEKISYLSIADKTKIEVVVDGKEICLLYNSIKDRDSDYYWICRVLGIEKKMTDDEEYRFYCSKCYKKGGE